MIKFLDYCFYRLAASKFYNKVDPKSPWISALGLFSACELLNVLTLVNIYEMVTNSRIEEGKTMVITVAIPIYIINTLRLSSERKYLKQVEYYKDEKNKIRTRKGWAVFCYIILSFVLFFVTGFSK